MKKIHLFALFIGAVVLGSCKTQIIPKAINSVNSVGLEELNLVRQDYQVLKTVNAEAAIRFHQQSKNKFIIREQNGDFVAEYKRIPHTKIFSLVNFEGIARYGFLNNDYGMVTQVGEMEPEGFARHLVIYRLINACKISGGDGVIEPVISMNIGQEGRDIIFTASASAKIIKLKTDK